MARIEQSIEVSVPAAAAYEQLTRFEQYPSFMDDIEQVRQLDDTHLHWRTKAGNLDMEWDAEITEQVPGSCIAWRHTSKPHYAGRIELQPLAPDRTRITVSIDSEHGQQILAQHGDAERAVAQRAEHGLARFKKFMEARRPEARAEGPARQTQASGDGQRNASAPQGQPQAQARQPEQPQRQDQGQQGQQQERPGRAGMAGMAGGERPWIPNLMQMWDEPLSMMRKMSEEMDQLVGKFIGRPGAPPARSRDATPASWSPPVEIAQGEDKMVICAELPGVRPDEVRVEIKNDRVTIEGERRPPQQAQEMQRSERSYGHFYRVIALPEGAEPDAASAALRDGLLEITVPVPEGGRRARRIEIRGG